MLDTSFSRVVATTLKGYSKDLTDNIVGRQLILWKMGELGGIETRPGATSIVEPVMLNKNTTVQSYSAWDPLNTSAQGGITAAEFPWRQVAGTTGLPGIEKFKNSGSATQIINLWDAIGDQLAESMRLEVNRMMFLDGTGNSARDLYGLDLLVEEGTAWSTVGEIDSNAELNWRNQWLASVDVSGADATAGPLVLKTVRQLINRCSGGGDWPHLAITSLEVHEKAEAALVTEERTVRTDSDADLVKHGWANFIIKNVPFCFDDDIFPHTSGAGSATAGHGLLVLTLSYLKFIMGEGYDFSFTDPIRPDNQDAELIQCLLYANMIAKNRRRQGRCNLQAA